MSPSATRGRIAVVLQRPRVPENIGAAARAAMNMGVTELIVVTPEDYDLNRIRKMATHTAREIVEGIQVHEDLKSALAPFSYVFGTTARLGGQRAVIH